MAKPKMEELAQQLLQCAREGRVQWKEGLGRSYDVHFPDVSVSITQTGFGIFGLSLINHEGVKLESLVSHRDDPLGKTLKEIHEIARRQMSDIDGTIEKALEYLRRA